MLLTVCVLANCVAVAVAEPPEKEHRSRPVEAVELEMLGGRPLTMTNFDRRRGTAILFLSARCPITASAIQELNTIHKKYRLRDVLFVGVCSNPTETEEELKAFCQSHGVIFPVYRDSQGKTARQFGAHVTPEVFLLDEQGRELYHGSAGVPEERSRLDAAIARLLQQQTPEPSQARIKGTALESHAPAVEHEDPYGSIGFSSELIFEKIPGAPAHHCSTITEAPNGDLVCVWYGGSYESADDQVLFLSRRKAGQRAWSTPEVVIPAAQLPGNAIVFTDASRRVWIVWGRMESPRPIRRGSGWGECRLMYRTSGDSGATWSDDKPLIDELGSLPRNVPIHLASGDMLVPLSGRVGSERGSFFMITRDDGQTWERSAVIAGGSQPTVVQRSDGSLLCFMRNEPRILMSESRDLGRTWSAATPTQFNNPDAGIAMTRLQSGALVLVFNDTPDARTPLCIVRSGDNGQTWDTPLKLEANPGEYSYPCAIPTADGRIHVTYTFRRYSIKHVEFNEDWLTRFERPN
ncbi:MAG: exo-alpha-sialidase [Candidatus Hydrogenedentes bacterium]|nr:exo-alpha-sialidase [Candidatus Hydrogenedentota bacterium]